MPIPSLTVCVSSLDNIYIYYPIEPCPVLGSLVYMVGFAVMKNSGKLLRILAASRFIGACAPQGSLMVVKDLLRFSYYYVRNY